MSDTPKCEEFTPNIAQNDVCVRCGGDVETHPPAPAGLDFEAVQRELNMQYAHCATVPEPHRPLLQAQHRALLAAAVAQARREEQEKHEAYPRRPLPQGMTPEEELEYWRSETLALDTWHDIQNKRVKAIAPLVQLVREWQEARRKFYREMTYDQRVGTDPFAHEERRRIVAAEKLMGSFDLSALPLPEVML